MSVAIANREGKSVARPLRVLVPLIQEDLKNGSEAAQRAAMPYYQAAGEKLLEAKDQLPHGEFVPWVERNFQISIRQAQRYIELAEATHETKNAARVVFPSIRAMERTSNPHIGTGKTTWHEPVKKIIGRVDTDTLNLKRDELKRADERAAQRELALQLIDIGYKVLARTLHPDKGGSREAMARLNQVRDRLKQYA